MILSGTVTDNLGKAHITIPKQKPFFRSKMPEIDAYRNGTINLILGKDLGAVAKYDHYFKNLRWDDNDRGLLEDFGFIHIRALTHNGVAHQDWGYLYFPMASPNRKNKKLLELVDRQEPDVQRGDTISISIDDGCILQNSRLGKLWLIRYLAKQLFMIKSKQKSPI